MAAYIPSEKRTTLDHIHTAMLYQMNGDSIALKSLLRQESERGPNFIRLGNALSTLYPRNSREKRVLDAVLLIFPA